jgi:DNA-binding IclR family transcriptional regulator
VSEPSAPKTGVDAVNRALSILMCFTTKDDRLTLTEIAKRTGLYKSTALRLIESLELQGFLVRQDGRGYTLGAELMRLGSLYARQFRLEDWVRPILLRLVAETGESAAFYRREGNRRICLFRCDSPSPIRDHVREGDVLSLDKGAGGRALAGFAGKSAPEIQARLKDLPYISHGERDNETGSVAVPIFGLNDELLGAISVSGPVSRFTPERIERARAALMQGARELSQTLGSHIYP